MFSIVIPLYNKEKFIERCLNSVLKQSFTKFEIIIVNDGSIDKSENKVLLFDDPRIRYFSNSNMGVSFSRNFGISKARFDWICFLDADDYWNFNHLETLFNGINEFPKAKMLTTATLIFQNQKLTESSDTYSYDFRGYVSEYFKYASQSTIFNSSSVCINRNVFISGFYFNENLNKGEDLDLWFRIIMHYSVAYIKSYTVIYDMSDSSSSNKSFVSIDKHVLSIIGNYYKNDLSFLDNYIQYFVRRNLLHYYYFDKNVIKKFTKIKFLDGAEFYWKILYNRHLYLVLSFLYFIYKKLIHTLRK